MYTQTRRKAQSWEKKTQSFARSDKRSLTINPNGKLSGFSPINFRVFSLFPDSHWTSANFTFETLNSSLDTSARPFAVVYVSWYWWGVRVGIFESKNKQNINLERRRRKETKRKNTRKSNKFQKENKRVLRNGHDEILSKKMLLRNFAFDTIKMLFSFLKRRGVGGNTLRLGKVD